MLELGFGFGYLCLYVDHVAKGYGILVGAYHEGGGGAVFLAYCSDALEVCHLHDGFTVGTGQLRVDNLQGEFFFWCNVLLRTDGTYTADNLLDILNIVYKGLLIFFGCIELQTLTHDALAILALVECLPEGFGDERHEGVEHLQQGVEEAEGGIVGLAVDRLCLAVDVCWLHHLEIPAGELIPEELVYCHECIGDAVLGEVVVELGIGFLQLSLEPCDCQF